MYDYAIALEQGKFGTTDLELAARYFQRAARTNEPAVAPLAEAGVARVYNTLGRIPSVEPMPPEPQPGIRPGDAWLKSIANALKSAADSGSPQAMFIYARALDSGLGVEQNFVEAFEYFGRAGESGIGDAHGFRAVYYLLGQGVQRSEELGMEELRKAVEQTTNLDWQFLYARRWDARGNPTEAVRYYKMAADQGHMDSQMKYACYVGNGHGCEQDLQESYKYMKMAADQGLASAQYAYGMALVEGDVLQKDLKLAARYVKRAADQGNLLARHEYSRIAKQLARERCPGGQSQCCVLM
jgi:TPR repeat protein